MSILLLSFIWRELLRSFRRLVKLDPVLISNNGKKRCARKRCTCSKDGRPAGARARWGSGAGARMRRVSHQPAGNISLIHPIHLSTASQKIFILITNVNVRLQCYRRLYAWTDDKDIQVGTTSLGRVSTHVHAHYITYLHSSFDHLKLNIKIYYKIYHWHLLRVALDHRVRVACASAQLRCGIG